MFLLFRDFDNLSIEKKTYEVSKCRYRQLNHDFIYAHFL